MFLYHGTSREYLTSILKNGLCPRSVTGYKSKTNYDDDWAASSDGVYLTSDYAAIYAYWKSTVLGVIFEVNMDMLDEVNFRPDEDYLVHIIPNRHTVRMMQKADNYKWMWKKSLYEQGQLRYRGIIPPNTITRYVVVERHNLPDPPLSFEISLEYHKDNEGFHRAGMLRFFEGSDKTLALVNLY